MPTSGVQVTIPDSEWQDSCDHGVDYVKVTAGAPSGTPAAGEKCLNTNEAKLYEESGLAWDGGTAVSDGDRFVFKDTGTDGTGDSGAFTKTDEIYEYSSSGAGSFDIYTPTDGATTKLDDESLAVYDYDGSDWVARSGGSAHLDSFTQNNGQFIATDQVKARDTDGLQLTDKDGNGITIADGGQVTIAGDLVVSGDVVNIDVANLLVEDPLILLAKGNATDALDLGLVGVRDSNNIAWIWDESADEFAVIETTDDGTTVGNVTIADYKNLHVGALVADDPVSIGAAAPDTSALLDLVSTAKGFLLPRMTAAQRVAISSPVNGLVVYQTDGAPGIWLYKGSWELIGHTQNTDTSTDSDTFRIGTGGPTLEHETQLSTGDLIINRNVEIYDIDTLAGESLEEGDFSTSVYWDPTGDWDDSGPSAIYTHSGGSGNLTQTSANMAIAGVGDKYYLFEYDIVSPSGDVAFEITAAFAAIAQSLDMVAGTDKQIIFKSKASPEDFVIAGTSTSGAATLDNVSLKEIQGGALTTHGPVSFDSLQVGGASGAVFVDDNGDPELQNNGTRHALFTISNVILGAGAGAVITSNNTGAILIGNAAGALLQNTGLHNIAIGNAALSSATGGDYNVCIGFDAGKNNAISGCVFIGYEAGKDESLFNTLYISYSNNSLPLIYGEFPNGKLKFTAPEITQRTTTEGGISRKISEATATLTGASTVIQVNIPTNSKLIGVTLRVDTLITSGDGATSWAAAWSGGATQAIATGQAFAQNTKVYTFFDANAATAIASGETDITITPNSNTFSGGVVRAWAVYEELPAVPSV